MVETVGTLTLLSCAGALALTPLVRLVAVRYRLFDSPHSSERKTHPQPVPRVGGVAVLFAFFLALLLARFWERLGMAGIETLSLVAVGAFCFFMLGLLDDLMTISAYWKLAVQFTVALGLAAAGLRIEALFGTALEPGIAVALTTLWLVGIVNTINFIDGLDGLAAGVGLIAAAAFGVIALLQGKLVPAMLSAALIGALAGFLPFNFYRADIFLGDSGALLIGYLLGAISIIGLYKTVTVAFLPIPILILLLPISDTLFAIVRRLSSNKSPAEADRKHIHHRLLDFLGERYFHTRGEEENGDDPEQIMSTPMHRTTVLLLWLLTAACAGTATWLAL